jgi:hypothetical protein
LLSGIRGRRGLARSNGTLGFKDETVVVCFGGLRGDDYHDRMTTIGMVGLVVHVG